MQTRNLLLILLTLLAAITLSAQSGKVRGRVMDSTGSVMPGVRVKLSQGDKVVKETSSTSTGEFEIAAEPGDYRLEITAPDFAPYAEMVKVMPDMRPLSITMLLAPFSQNVEVTENRTEISIDPDSSLQTTVLDKEFIDTLPDNEDELAEYLQEIAGSRGSAGGNATFIIDGFTGGRIPPKDQIREIRIGNNPFSSEFSGIGYGRSETITRAGTGEFQGNINFGFRQSSLNGRDPFLTTTDGSPAIKPPAQTRNFQSNFSGPIIRNKLSLNLNVHYFDNENTSTIRAIIPASDGTGQSYSAPYVSANRIRSTDARSQFAIDKNNTLYVNYQIQHQQRPNRLSGGPTTLQDRAADNVVRNSEFQIRETAVLTNSLVHEVRFEYGQDFAQTTPHLVAEAINVLDAFNGGGGQNNSLSTNRRLEMSNLLMFSGKKWTVKSGFQSLYRRNHSLQQNNFIGTFTFSSLADYIAGRPLQFTQRRGNPLLDVNQLEVASFIQNDWKMTPKFNLSLGARYEAQTNISDHDNIDPRIGLAYQLTKTMVLRGGAGIFHQRLDEQIVEGLFRLDGARQQQIIIFRPAFPDPFLGGNSALAPITRRTQASDLVTPYTTDASVSLEKSLPKGLGLTFSWYTSRGVHLYRSRNANAPLPDSDVAPDPSQGPVFQLESTGNSKSNNYTIGWQERLRNKWSLRLFGNYTLGYTKNDTDGWQSFPVNSYDMRSEWGRAGSDTRHRFLTGANWNMPGDLNITTQVNWSSSRPYTITTGSDDNNDGIINDRPVDPLTGKMIARNTGVGAGIFNINLSVQKTVKLKGSEKSAPDTRAGNNGPNGVNHFAEPQRGSNRQNIGPTMTIRAYFQNLLNTVQYGNYVGTMTSPFFGHAISTARPARQIELGLRFNF